VLDRGEVDVCLLLYYLLSNVTLNGCRKKTLVTDIVNLLIL